MVASILDFLASSCAPNFVASELCLDTFLLSLGHLTLVRLISFRSCLRVSNSFVMLSSFSILEMELASDVLNPPVGLVVSKVHVSVDSSGPPCTTKGISVLPSSTVFGSGVSGECVSCLSLLDVFELGISDECVSCLSLLDVFESGISDECVSCLSLLDVFELGVSDECVSCLSLLYVFESGISDECVSCLSLLDSPLHDMFCSFEGELFCVLELVVGISSGT